MAVYVSGSLAFDRLMTFPGVLRDSLMTDQDRVSVSFMVEGLKERRGGCAGNIAYGLALLGRSPVIVAAAGIDFDGYASFLESHGVSLEGVTRVPDLRTAFCYVTTDRDGSQITIFYPGAMTRAADYAFGRLDPASDIAIVSPGNMDDMRRLPELYKSKKVPYIYDPGQQIPVLSREDMLRGIEGSLACVTNDYELEMICKKLDVDEKRLLGMTRWLITTLGADGQRVRGADGTDVRIPAIPCAQVADPTGAGDAHRAGVLAGLELGLPMPDAARMGAVSAAYAVELMGTQEHSFTKQEFAARHEAAFGPLKAAL